MEKAAMYRIFKRKNDPCARNPEAWARRPRRQQPRLEALESRMLMSLSREFGGVLGLLNGISPWYIWRYRLDSTRFATEFREVVPCRRICPASVVRTSTAPTTAIAGWAT